MAPAGDEPGAPHSALRADVAVVAVPDGAAAPVGHQRQAQGGGRDDDPGDAAPADQEHGAAPSPACDDMPPRCQQHC